MPWMLGRRGRLILLLGVAAAGVIVIGLPLWQRPLADSSLVAVVRRGALTARLTTTGALRPIRSLTYRSPVVGREVEILDLAPEGTRVNEGDLLVRIDTTETERDLDRAQQELRQAQLDLEVAEGETEEAAAAMASTTEGDGALAVTESRTRLQLAEKKRERLRQEFEQLQPLQAKGYITREELGRTASELEQADEELELMRKRATIVEQQTHPREQRRAVLQLAQKEAQLGRARTRLQETSGRVTQIRHLIDDCRLYARGPGMVVYEEFLSVNPRRKIRVGDRVTTSQGIVTIPEVGRMLVDASVSEAELHRVHPGQFASVHAEAFSDVVLRGQVVRVGTLASSSVYRPLDDKRFDLIIELEPADADLRPQMTVRADITVGQRDNVLLVPVNAVFGQTGEFVAHVAAGRVVETRPITLGESNDDVVEVVSGLAEGERVLITAPPGTGAGVTRPTPGVTGGGSALSSR